VTDSALHESPKVEQKALFIHPFLPDQPRGVPVVKATAMGKVVKIFLKTL
jgi:hypothetical protein